MYKNQSSIIQLAQLYKDYYCKYANLNNYFMLEVFINKTFFFESLDKCSKKYGSNFKSETCKKYIYSKKLIDSFLEININSEIKCFNRKTLNYKKTNNYKLSIINDRINNINYFHGLVNYNDIILEKKIIFNVQIPNIKYTITIEFLICTKNIFFNKKEIIETKYKIKIYLPFRNFSYLPFSKIKHILGEFEELL